LQIRILKIGDWRPTSQSDGLGWDKRDFSAVETEESESKRGKCAAIFPEGGNGLQRPHWLVPLEDSNLEMLFSKLAFEIWFEFHLISERNATGDFSRQSCEESTCTCLLP
jgi:hypothetical protein